MSENLMTALVTFALFSIGGWAMIYISCRGSVESKNRFERERAHASARIVELIPREVRYGRRGRRTFWYPVVSFMADGRECRVEGKDGLYEGDASVGDEVDIRYDPDDPARFHLERYPESDSRSNRLILWFGIAWIAVAAVAAMLGAGMA